MLSAPDHNGGSDNRHRNTATIWLVAIVLAGLLLRLWLWRYRWINPDEGAHLMDGRLVLDGLVPLVDFSSRQVLYTYILAGLISLVGPDYTLVRLGVLLTTAATTCMVFAIGLRLFGQRVGLLAAGIYVSIPLAIVWGPIVHMEPFASLAACLAVYALLRHLEPDGTWRTLALAGALLGLGFYVRESGLAVTFAALCALAICTWREPARLARRLGVVLAGFLVPCVALAALYARHLTPSQWWESSLNPLSLVLAQMGNLAPAAGPAGTLRLVGQPWAKTMQYFREIVRLDAFLLVGAALSVALLLAALRRRDELPAFRLPYAFLYPWVGGLALVYGYWGLHRGLFPQYSEEFLPPLAILLAFVVDRIFTRWTGAASVRWAILGLATCGGAAFAAFRLAPTFEPSRPLYLAIPAVAVAWWQLGGRTAWRRWLGVAALSALGLAAVSAAPEVAPAGARALKLLAVPAIVALVWLAGRTRRALPRTRGFAAYLGVVLLAAAVAYSFGAAAAIVRADYETPWSPGAVREVAGYIRAHSRAGDEVMSGGVIWEFQADRRPFAAVSHPAAFAVAPPPDKLRVLERRWASHPPRFVVLDGYTERTYGAVLRDFPRTLGERYALVDSATGSRYPVRVCRLREPATR